jgi:hypothetical protein
MAGENKNPIFGIKTKAFYEKKWFLEFISAGPPAVAALVAAVKTSGEQGIPTWVAIAALLGFSWLLLTSIAKVMLAARQDAAEDDLRNHDGLRAALHVLHSTVSKAGGLESEEKDRCLRVTFHRVVPPLDNCDHIEQIVPYVGGGGNGSGRKFHIRSGITGRAIRDNAPYVMDRESDSFDEYKKQLITDWGYTEADARGFTSDRFSLMAIPVTSKGGQAVLGVIYLDCSKKKFFSSEIVKEAVLSGCVGVARYTGERYA